MKKFIPTFFFGLFGLTYSIPSLADLTILHTHNGILYEIKSKKATWEDLSSKYSMTETFWWGNEVLSESLSDSYSKLLNIDDNDTGAYFIYARENTGEVTDISPNGEEIAKGKVFHIDRELTIDDGVWIGLENIYAYTDNPLNKWAQPYAAMLHVGLDVTHNQTKLVLDKAGECKNNGWNIDNGKYCIFAVASNSTTDVYGNSNYGGYETNNFISSYGIELNHDDAWTIGLSYGKGTSNIDDYNFSDTTASIKSDNNFYSAYAVKQANKNLKLSWLLGLSDYSNEGKRTYSGSTTTSSYMSNGYAFAMDAAWNKKVISKKGRPYTFQPKVGLAYASNEQDRFSESGGGNLMSISKKKVDSFLLKGGIDVSTQLVVNQGKNLFIPRLGLGYEIDLSSDSDTSDSIKANLTESTSDPATVKAKIIGRNKGMVNVGADYYLTERLMMNTNASIKVTGEGSESSYSGGFSWFF